MATASSKKRNSCTEPGADDDFAAEFKRIKAAVATVSAEPPSEHDGNEYDRGVGDADTQFRTIVLYFAVFSVPSVLMAPVAFQDEYRTAVVVSSSSSSSSSSSIGSSGPGARECFLIPYTDADECSMKDLRQFVRQGSMISNRCLFRIHSRAFIRRGDDWKACAHPGSSKGPAQTRGGLYTLQRMFDEGVEGFLHPLKSVGMVQSDIPFCLRNEGIRSMELDSMTGHDEGSGSSSFLVRRGSMFENMCGSVYVPQYHMPLNEWHNLKHFQKSSPAGNGKGHLPPVSREFVCSSCCRKADRRRSCLEDCSEVFSIHGNITLRRDSSGVAVSFKVRFCTIRIARLEVESVIKKMISQGVKDVARVTAMINMLIKGHPGESSSAGEVYKVHMAVVTANIGKRVTVAHGNHMSSTLWKAVHERGGSLNMAYRTDEVGRNDCGFEV
jgi:hypothetical protein